MTLHVCIATDSEDMIYGCWKLILLLNSSFDNVCVWETDLLFSLLVFFASFGKINSPYGS